MTRMIAKAAQRYGMIVRDQTGHAISLFAENRAQYGTDPYTGRRVLRRPVPQPRAAGIPVGPPAAPEDGHPDGAVSGPRPRPVAARLPFVVVARPAPG